MSLPIYDSLTKSYKQETVKNAQLDRKGEPKDHIEVITGDDKDPSVFHPQMKLQRWENEANVSFRLLHDWIPGTKIENDEENGIMTWRKKLGKKEWIARFYEDWETEDGSYKFVELVLPERPPVNEISFSVVSKDVDFFYQPELTPEEIAEGAERPENVVGSYAIYSKSSGGMNETSGKDYKCGKVGHLYRAKLIDANGNEIWGDYNTDLNDTEILTLGVDPTWLDSAVYPVVVDPTFGYTTTGSTTLEALDDYRYGNYPISSSESGTLVSMSSYCASSSASSEFSMAIYLDSDNSLVDFTSEGNLQTAPDWITLNFPSTPGDISATNYILQWWLESGTKKLLKYDSETGQTIKRVSDFYNYSWPNPGDVTDSVLFNVKLSIYATYTPSGGEPSTIRRYYSPGIWHEVDI